MTRAFTFSWLALFVCSSTIAVAQESSPKPTRSVGEEVSSKSFDAAAAGYPIRQREHGLEAILHEPAGLEFPSGKPVAVGDILDQLHKQHGLSIRFDVPTLSALYGGAGPGPAQNIGIGRSDDGSLTATVGKKQPSNIGVGIPNPPDATSGSADGRASVAAAPSENGSAHSANVSRPASSRRTPEPVVRAQSPTGPASLPPPIEAQTSTSTSANAALPPAYPPAATKPSAATSESHCDKQSSCQVPETFQSYLDQALMTEVDVRHVDLQSVSVATALRIALEALPATGLDDEASGLPITLTNASLFDYLVDDDGILITTRLTALAHKETRVYSVKHLKDITSAQLATVIRQSVRPWSWRSRIDEIGDQLRASTAHVPAKALGEVLKAGFQAAADATGVSLASDQADDKSEAKSDAKKPAAEMSDAEQAEMLGNAVVNGLVTFAHTTLTALEIAHYADPPTGSIQTLPGKLIITQSQAAHREIADLLKQLGDE